MLALLIALAAAPRPHTLSVELHWEEKLKITTQGQTVEDNTRVATRAKLRTERRPPEGADPAASRRATPPEPAGARLEPGDVLSVEPAGYPAFTVRDDSGAPVVVFKEPPASLAIGQVLRRAFGRLAVPDPERPAMSSCTPETEAATGRWLKTAVARLNGTEPGDVELSKLAVRCAPSKSGTKLEVAFAAKVPRATLTITLEQQGTLLVDRALWFTQWKVEGPVHVKGSDVSVEGSFASSLQVK